MTPWSWERLLELAPDAKSIERARKFFFSRKWLELAGNGEWLWGVYAFAEGREVRPSVHLPTARFHCDCNSPRRPCPHALALILLLLNAQERLRVSDPPDWVRQSRAERMPPAPIRPDESRRHDRLQLMSEGVGELERWLSDTVRQGLYLLAEQPSLVDEFAARMVDYQLGGIARQLRSLLPWISTDDWPRYGLERWGQLYLFVRAWQQLDRQPPARRSDLYQLAGLNLRKEEVLAQPPTDDHWLVVGRVQEVEEPLYIRRVWLRGERTARMALLLDFAHGSPAYERAWPVGSAWVGRLHYYPSGFPQRALLARAEPSRQAYEGLQGLRTFAQLRDAFRQALLAQPWLLRLAIVLEDVTPLPVSEQIVLADSERQTIELAGSSPLILLAISGGRPLTLIGEWDGRILLPLAVVTDGQVVGV